MNNVFAFLVGGFVGLICLAVWVFIVRRNLSKPQTSIMLKIEKEEAELNNDILQIGIEELKSTNAGRELLISRGINVDLEDVKKIEELHSALVQDYDSTLENWSQALTKRDKETELHTQQNADTSLKLALADELFSTGCIQFGEFTLKSGLKSPIYIDLRRVITYPKLLEQIGAAYLPILEKLKFDRLAGLPYAAIPIATAVSLQGNYPMIYPRKEVKTYGTKAEIEGEYRKGETVVVIDDLVTTGGTKFEAIEKLITAGLMVKDVVVLIDRQSGAKESLEASGYSLYSVFTINEILEYWEQTDKMNAEKVRVIRSNL